MTPKQGEMFDRAWKKDITDRIVKLNSAYISLQQKYPSQSKSVRAFNNDVENIKTLYKEFTNKFLDIFLLAHIFMIQNTKTSNGMVIYLGSLHSFHVEKYMEEYGFNRIHRTENKSLDACLKM